MFFDKEYTKFYKTPNLTSDQEKFLFEEIKEVKSESARKKLIESYLKLVLKISKNYWTADVSSKYDVIHDGIIGLIESIEKFDASSDVQFKTFAYTRIRSSIQEGLRNHLNKIKIPKKKVSDARKLGKFLENYKFKNEGREPSFKEICQHMDKKPKQIESIAIVLDILRMKDESIGRESLSIVDERADLQRRVEREQDTKFILDIIESMPILYKKIISLRYGFLDGEERTWRQISEEMNISHENARSKHNEAIEIIKKNIV